MSIAQPRFVEIKFTRKFDFWEASRALRAKKAPKYAIEPYTQVRYKTLRTKKPSPPKRILNIFMLFGA